MVGLILGALPGLLSFSFALRMVFAKEGLRAGVRRSCGDWAGSAVLCLLFSLGGQNFFDFSIALSGIATGVVMLVCILERRFVEARSLASSSSAEKPVVDGRSSFWGNLATRPLPVMILWTMTLAGSLFLLRDCWHAASLQQEFFELNALILEPDPTRLIEDGDRLLAAMNGVLAVRPDDETLRRYRVLLMMRLAERELYLEALGNQQLDPPQQRQLFRAVGFHALALRFLTVESAEDRLLFAEAAGRALQKYRWTEEAWRLLRTSPLVSEVAAELLTTGVFEPLQGDAGLLVNHVLFAEPNAADRLAAVGEYLVLTGDSERGLEVWRHSLTVSERFRPGILTAAANIYGVGAALELFAPTTFESAAVAAERLSNGELRQALLEDAERYWEAGGFRLTVPLCLVRAEHLRLQGRADEAVDFLQEQLLLRPGNLELLLRRAQVLEQAGRNSDAYDEWVRIREIDPELPEVEKSLTRLSRLPPTSVPEDAGVREFEARKSEEAEKKAEQKAEKKAEDRRPKKRDSVSPVRR